MPDFSQRSQQKELLDRDDIPFDDIRRNMQELEIINKFLGGHSITLAGIKHVLRGAAFWGPLSICEIGCGGGDNLKAIYRWAKFRKIEIKVIGIDINPDCITYARENCSMIKDAEWIVSDYRNVNFKNTPLIIFSSLFSHHFTNHELIAQLQWMKRNSSFFFINDLHRHPLAYHSIKLLTRFFSKSYLVKNDAPLSVLRGFSRSEWKELLNNAGIEKFELKWKWAFRWLVIVRREVRIVNRET